MDKTPTASPYTLTDFLARVDRTRSENMESLALWHEVIAAYANHPGMQPNWNLFQDPRGNLWTHASKKDACTGRMINGFARHNREVTFLDRVRNAVTSNGDFRTDLPEGSVRGRYEEWVWEKVPGVSTEEAIAKSFQEILNLQDSAVRAHAAILFADYLLKMDPSKLRAWFKHRAETTDRNNFSWHEDQKAFFEKFGRDAGISQMNDAHQFFLGADASISMVLNALVGRTDPVWFTC